MPNFGGGTGTPIAGGASTVGTVSPLPYTYLALPRYAKIMGLNPAHFSRADASSFNPQIFPVDTCSSVWPRYNWQNNDQVSHEELAYAIKSAEDDIVALCGYFPAPDWVNEEIQQYPRDYDRSMYGVGYDVRFQHKKVVLDRARFILAGKRTTTLIATATTGGGGLTFVDSDGDGLAETAQIVAATTVTDPKEIHLFFSGYSMAREWEIRPLKTKAISGGVVTITCDAWLLIDPEVLALPPTSDGFRAIDISTTAHYVAAVDVGRVYTDSTVVSSVFNWTDITVCLCPTSPTQNGSIQNYDAKNGVVTPLPSTWDTTLLQWNVDVWVNCSEPDWVKLWYYSGDMSKEYLAGISHDPLSDFWAQTIAWIATARLTRPLCGCNTAKDLADYLSEDLSLTEGGRAHILMPQLFSNPLGTKRGEVQAWKRISKMVRDRRASFALV